ncbi:DUF192 domain-containing protein [Halovulum dunhuangense]|uniref:DUF192 domain-containing protein n=1 Tax=Halovulum dunhuangense TaxID=1505036 RepID=UPI0031B58534
MRAVAALTAALILGAMPLAAQEVCAPDVVDLRSGDVTARFTVEVADTPESRALGLMNRPEMPQFAGMLFVYEAPTRASFWMKNTLISLDMLFADETGTVTRIHRDATPLSTDPIPGGDDILYVLEINGGMSDLLGLAEGTQLRHPAMDPAIAAWPCPQG